MNSILLRRNVAVAGKRLLDALAEEEQINISSARTLGNATILKRWRAARKDVERSAEHYAIALENYSEAVLTEMKPQKS